MKKISCILFLFFSCLFAKATHQVAGYISFKWISGTTYRVTFTNYTNVCGTLADRDTLRIFWGDGTSSLLVRNNGPVDPNTGYPEGQIITTGNCHCRKLNLYDTTHTFPGPGTYFMHIDDQDRMANIANMTGSVGQDFFMYTTIIIGPVTGDDINSPVITNPLACIYACAGECYNYNLGAYSPSGDSLSYSLGQSLTATGVANGYYLPPGITLNAKTGTFTWCSPPNPAFTDDTIYNFVILVNSYKSVYYGGHVYKLETGTMECEFEVLVRGNCKFPPPTVSGPNDTCVVANTNLTINYVANATNPAPLISLTASGEPFGLSPPATQSVFGPNPPVTLTFNWKTNCSDVRINPYAVLVTATENTLAFPLTNLNAYQNTEITVVGPAPTHLVANPIGNAVQLHWNPSVCTQVKGYSIYRHTGCYKWLHGPCETGVPAYTGYTLIGTNNGGVNDTNYLDNNGGKGLVSGLYYDYMVVANYPLPDGSVSYASNDTCVKIKLDVPVIINVSVDSTASGTGKIFVRWIKPIPDPADLDTTKDPGPYAYVLKRATGLSGGSFIKIDSVLSPFFKSTIDTTYRDTLLNTYGTGYNYRLDLYSAKTVFTGSSATASSIYLSVKPDNNVLHLSWQSNVPWNDSLYSIYRRPPLGYPQVFSFVASVPGTQHTYNDSNLTNGKSFCYYVKSKSAYSDTSILHPLFDSSEIMCGIPKDTVPPCAPQFQAYAECDAYADSLIWNNPDHTCPRIHNNLLLYKIFYSAEEGGDMQLIETITNLNDTIFVRDSLDASVAGCYAVVAVDSFMNQSAPNIICVDNCPYYALPNVFTPNGDGKDDLFTPLPHYRFVKDIDISIFNRWGQLMFHTIDPDINWNGNDQSSKKPCPDGVYYYVCQAHEIHVTGIKTVNFKGFLQLLR